MPRSASPCSQTLADGREKMISSTAPFKCYALLRELRSKEEEKGGKATKNPTTSSSGHPHRPVPEIRGGGWGAGCGSSPGTAAGGTVMSSARLSTGTRSGRHRPTEPGAVGAGRLGVGGPRRSARSAAEGSPVPPGGRRGGFQAVFAS